MGVYYKVVCDARREIISPGDINDCGIKFGSITHPDHPLGPLVMWALGTRWHGQACRLINDAGGDDEADATYLDVTRELIATYNESCGDGTRELADFVPLRWTGHASSD